MYVKSRELVRAGEELFNITIMKQEKAVLSPVNSMVKRVLKTADYKHDKIMVPVKEGELLVVLGQCPGYASIARPSWVTAPFASVPGVVKRSSPNRSEMRVFLY